MMLVESMGNTVLYELLGTIARIDTSESSSETVQIFCNVLEHYGFSDFLITGLPMVPDERWERGIICDGWSPEWFEHYLQQGHFLHDPCVTRSRHAYRPFFWHEIDRTGLRKRSHRVMDEATEFGLKDGICVPIHVPLAGPAVVTAASERVDVPANMLPFIETLCVHTFRSVSNFRKASPPDKRPRLTPREREILQWSAAGKTAEDIGVILNITKHTVESHRRHICDKLDANNLVHAVAKAVRLGEIEI
jgi:LuxR family quorum sensing-dependent transcriptional regulator